MGSPAHESASWPRATNDLGHIGATGLWTTPNNPGQQRSAIVPAQELLLARPAGRAIGRLSLTRKRPQQQLPCPRRRPGGVLPSCASSDELGPCWVRAARVLHGHQRSPTVAKGSEEPQVAGRAAHAAGMMQAADSDCGPEGQESSPLAACWTEKS
jgi:hypothetical protein